MVATHICVIVCVCVCVCCPLLTPSFIPAALHRPRFHVLLLALLLLLLPPVSGMHACSYAQACGQCHAPFKPLLRLRHHCRLCGKVFCDACSSSRLLLPPRFRERAPQRVCELCASLLQPLQPFLIAATAAAAQPPVHDDFTVSLRCWLNSPWGSSMPDELYKSANIARAFVEVCL